MGVTKKILSSFAVTASVITQTTNQNPKNQHLWYSESSDFLGSMPQDPRLNYAQKRNSTHQKAKKDIPNVPYHIPNVPLRKKNLYCYNKKEECLLPLSRVVGKQSYFKNFSDWTYRLACPWTPFFLKAVAKGLVFILSLVILGKKKQKQRLVLLKAKHNSEMACLCIRYGSTRMLINRM